MAALRLPAFHVGRPRADAGRLVDVGRALFGADVFSVGEDEAGLHARAGWLRVEADAASGSIWAADHRQLWNPALYPKLISPRRARVFARDLLGELGLEPGQESDGDPATSLPLVALEPGATLVAARAGGDRIDRQLDVQARFTVEVPLGPESAPAPVVGGGGRIGVVFGHEGRVIGLRAALRPVHERFEVDAIDQAEADERFRALTEGLEVSQVASTLAYYAAPAGVCQEVMAPVYLYRALVEADGRTVPMRLVTVAASDVGLPAPSLGATRPAGAEAGRPATARGLAVATGHATGDCSGHQDLEWLVVAADGLLEDDIVAPGGGDVLDRWDGAFAGLHQLLGYGAAPHDTTEESEKIVAHARRGATVAAAWFRTAQEVQPSTNGLAPPFGPDVWAGVLWAARPGADPIDDHLWGHGPVSPDPTDPTVLSCMWTTC